MMNYANEIEKTSSDIKSAGGDFKIALLSDSHLSNSGIDTAEHILKVDQKVKFNCMVHCGNFLNGDNPKNISMEILREEFDMYKSSVESEIFLPVQGKNDGWRDERCLGQLTCNIMTDEVWSEQIKFLDDYPNLNKPSGKPYYYIDFPNEGVRIVVLCSFFYDVDMELGIFEKYCGYTTQQLRWLRNEAFKTDKTVFIFSNRLPKSRFETGEDQFVYKGRSTESNLIIFQDAKRDGADIAAWIAGGYDFDEVINVGGINLVTINTQLGTKREVKDCWDSVVLNKKERKLHFFRFGAGEDRVISY